MIRMIWMWMVRLCSKHNVPAQKYAIFITFSSSSCIWGDKAIICDCDDFFLSWIQICKQTMLKTRLKKKRNLSQYSHHFSSWPCPLCQEKGKSVESCGETSWFLTHMKMKLSHPGCTICPYTELVRVGVRAWVRTLFSFRYCFFFLSYFSFF